MRNVDKYLTEILASRKGACTVHMLRTGDVCAIEEKCCDCEKANKEWLEAEYVEKEADWNKVPMGTPVRVWSDINVKCERTFITYCEGSLFPFTVVDMKTKCIGHWKHAELIEVDNESNTND